MTDWKYCFPHHWDRERQVWEDVWLLPDDTGYTGHGLQLTVDALGVVGDPLHGSDREGIQRDALEKLGDSPFWIDADDMIVRQVDFSQEELVSWVRVWLVHCGLTVGQLRPARQDDFSGRLGRLGAAAISEVRRALRDGR